MNHNDSGSAAQLPQPGPAEHRGPSTEFTGSGGEYFRVWIVNVLLGILTLGFYTPWARRRTAQYFYDHSMVAGSPLEFTAQQRKMVRGFVMLVLLTVAYNIAAESGQDTAVALFLLAGAVLAPFIWASAMRFRLSIAGAATAVHRQLARFIPPAGRCFPAGVDGRGVRAAGAAPGWRRRPGLAGEEYANRCGLHRARGARWVWCCRCCASFALNTTTRACWCAPHRTSREAVYMVVKIWLATAVFIVSPRWAPSNRAGGRLFALLAGQTQRMGLWLVVVILWPSWAVSSVAGLGAARVRGAHVN